MQKYVIEGTSIPNYSDIVKIDILDDMPSSLLKMLRLRKVIGHAKRRLLLSYLLFRTLVKDFTLNMISKLFISVLFYILIELHFLIQLMSIIISVM